MPMFAVKTVRERRRSTLICRRGTSLYCPSGFHYETLSLNLGLFLLVLQTGVYGLVVDFFIGYMAVEKLVEVIHSHIAFELTKLVDLDVEAFDVFVDPGTVFLFHDPKLRFVRLKNRPGF
jgi:hypothetical protein